MKIGRSTGYGLLAIAHIAKNRGKNLVMSQDISRQYDIPLEYLLKILQQLVRANLLKSKRGPNGGFALAKSPNKISLVQIIEAVDGPMTARISIADQAHGARLGVRADKLFARALADARAVFEKAKLSTLL